MLSIRTEVRSEFHWWMSNATTAFTNIMETNRPDLTLTTDASTTGWGQSVKEK